MQLAQVLLVPLVLQGLRELVPLDVFGTLPIYFLILAVMKHFNRILPMPTHRKISLL